MSSRDDWDPDLTPEEISLYVSEVMAAIAALPEREGIPLRLHPHGAHWRALMATGGLRRIMDDHGMLIDTFADYYSRDPGVFTFGDRPTWWMPPARKEP